MALSDTVKTLHLLLDAIKSDLGKAELGNKAAAQRVRTGTIKMEKVAKKYRKESIVAEKRGLVKRKPAKKKVAKKKAAKPAAKKPAKKVAKKKPAKKVAKRRR